MGLDTTHGAFNGPYSAFNRFRVAVMEAAGGSYPENPFVKGDDALWYYEPEALDNDERLIEGLKIFGCHSDCDGEMSPEECRDVADALERLYPHVSNRMPGVRGLTMKETTRNFIDGCRLAHSSDETLEFY